MQLEAIAFLASIMPAYLSLSRPCPKPTVFSLFSFTIGSEEGIFLYNWESLFLIALAKFRLQNQGLSAGSSPPRTLPACPVTQRRAQRYHRKRSPRIRAGLDRLMVETPRILVHREVFDLFQRVDFLARLSATKACVAWVELQGGYAGSLRGFSNVWKTKHVHYAVELIALRDCHDTSWPLTTVPSRTLNSTSS